MDVTPDDVMRVARLTDLQVTPEEVEGLARDMNQLLAHAQSLMALDLQGVPPLRHSAGTQAPLRLDEPRPGLAQAEALANAPATQSGCFLVPRPL